MALKAAPKPTAAKPAAKPALAKPAAAKPALAKPGKTPAVATKPKVEKPVKEAKPPKAPVVFDNGAIVKFKGYSAEGVTGNFTPGQELAVVGQSQTDGNDVLAVVAVADYHKYMEDNNAAEGEEILVSEVTKTSKVVEAPFALPIIGEMTTILKSEGGDTLAIAQKLYGDISKSYFYLGGMFAKLYKEKGDNGATLFTGYTNPEGKNYEDSKEGFEAFLQDNFGDDLGGYRKVMNLIDIYQSFSALPNAADVVKQLSGIGWWKAQLMAKYVTSDNAKEIIETAKTQSYDKLEETLKTSYTTEGTTASGRAVTARATIKKTTFAFKLYEDAGEAVEMIFKAAQKQVGSTDLNAVFEHIVHEWAATNLAEVAQKADAAKKRKLAALTKSGVKLPADHPNYVAPAAAAA